MSEVNKTVAASPVFKLPNIYPFIHKEYSWADFVAKVMTNLQDAKVRGTGRLAECSASLGSQLPSLLSFLVP
jgi:hypothetical protein